MCNIDATLRQTYKVLISKQLIIKRHCRSKTMPHNMLFAIIHILRIFSFFSFSFFQDSTKELFIAAARFYFSNDWLISINLSN
ncbi:MAG: hypothetical protein CVU54_10130 [Deltaproteobacteria bacterium HGW-Deltaproteobacteria-12]|nr:MAG: hypothetical protein CVU54_10130 [Deltaproteobacteria bacterium HGW-Deltaproteobacteria-12]